MIAYQHAFILPAAFALLPPKMDSAPARAMLIAIGLQESRFAHRRQLTGGPARGFYQFELAGGVAGVLTHPRTKPLIKHVCGTLGYPAAATACYDALEHNDVLAACFARLLLYTLPDALPTALEPDLGWQQYLRAWRPGTPHHETWDDHFARAWDTVTGGRP